MSKNKKPEGGWQLTFSDLLTLLLCFFVALIGFGQVKPMSGTGSISGIAFASTTVEGDTFQVNELLLHVQDFEDNQREVFQKRLKNFVFLEGYYSESLTLEVCAKGNPMQASKKWHEATQRMLEVNRQVIDAKVRKESIALRMTESLCELKSEEGVVAARVRVRFKKERKG